MQAISSSLYPWRKNEVSIAFTIVCSSYLAQSDNGDKHTGQDKEDSDTPGMSPLW